MSAKKLLLSIIMLLYVFFILGCSNYDPHRVKQTENHKRNYIEDVQRALKGELTQTEFRASLQSFDASMIEEQAKSGKGLDELKSKLDAETEKAIIATWGK